VAKLETTKTTIQTPRKGQTPWQQQNYTSKEQIIEKTFEKKGPQMTKPKDSRRISRTKLKISLEQTVPMDEQKQAPPTGPEYL
jgi:hypothetical protein